MKIVFLHLSDLHLQNLDGANPHRIQAAVNAMAVLGKFEGLVFIISGDLAARGSKNEYKNASTFIGRFTDEINKKFSISEKNLKLLVVPGNHDINYGGVVRATPEEIRKYDDEEKEMHLDLELKRMTEYFYFSNRNKCFFANSFVEYGKLVTRKILHFGSGYKVEANLLNTAPFSCDSDDGIHFLPEEAIQVLSRPSTADFSIAVMHHAPAWFNFNQSNRYFFCSGRQ